MLVDKITTTHFRNLASAEIEFSPGVNLLIGENGQGKTNLLEALAFFKLGRSFRANRDSELIRFGEQYCRVVADCKYKTGERGTFSAAVEQSGAKRIKTNGKQINQLSELVGTYPVVLFGPQDLRLVTGPPGDRRRFVDMVGSMTDRIYIELLRNYRRVLFQRNAALKARAGRSELRAWNAELVEKGCKLIEKRRNITATIDSHLNTHASGMDSPFVFTLSYRSKVYEKSEKDADSGNAVSTEKLAAAFEKTLTERENEELKTRTTMVGPHRDDINIDIDGRELRKFGSQGQKRLFAVLAKLSELSHLETELAEPSVLLLDDVFSEFDREITAKLQRVLEGERQVFVTSPVPLEWDEPRKPRVFCVTEGQLVV